MLADRQDTMRITKVVIKNFIPVRLATSFLSVINHNIYSLTIDTANGLSKE